MKNYKKFFDAVFIGGGMIGAAAALGLAQSGFSIALLEQKEQKNFYIQDAPDIRISSINYSSVQFLKKIGAWNSVLKMRVTPYNRLETWDGNYSSRIVFDSTVLRLPELGFMVENRVIQLAILQQLEKCKNFTLYCPVQLKNLQRKNNHWNLTLNSQEVLQARFLGGADGINSQVRKKAVIGIKGWKYKQSCLLITAQTKKQQNKSITWQHFSSSGIRAFLPLYNNQASLVLYDSPSRIHQLKSIPIIQLEKEIFHFFPDFLGIIKAYATGSFALIRRQAQHYVRSGLAILGDSAHILHPLAGQGVNLGFRDVNVLLDVVLNARQQGEDWTSEGVLKRYQRRRRADNLFMQLCIDLFYTTFLNQSSIPPFLRSLFFLSSEWNPCKIHALKYALGIY